MNIFNFVESCFTTKYLCSKCKRELDSEEGLCPACGIDYKPKPPVPDVKPEISKELLEKGNLFKKEILEICDKHNFVISHEDSQGAFLFVIPENNKTREEYHAWFLKGEIIG